MATQKLIDAIKPSLSAKPQSILEIAKEAKKDWLSTKNGLELLKSVGAVVETKEGKKRMFSIKTIPIKETWFGIPITSKEDRNTINFIYEKSKEFWLKKNKKPIGKTQANKVLAKVNKILNLKLPVGWYLYGQVCIEIFDPEKHYSFDLFPQASIIEIKIIEVINEYSKFTNVTELKRYQYEEFNNDLYKIKEKVLNLGILDLNKYEIQKFISLLLSMIPHLPQKDKCVIQLFTDYIGTVSELSSKLNENEFNIAKNSILCSFNELWTLIATEGFYESLINTGKYTEENLSPHFEEIIKIRIEEAIETLSTLQELANTEKTLKSLEYDDLKNFQGSSKKLSESEKHKINMSNLLRKIGFDN